MTSERGALTPRSRDGLRLVVFDMNETLTDLEPLRETFGRLGFSEQSWHWWFAALLRDGMALAAAGDHASFGELVAVALEEVSVNARVRPPEDATAQVIARFRQVPVYPDVADATQQLREREIHSCVLTNGSSGLAREILSRAGVIGQFDDVLSVDEIGAWKPRREPYEYVARRFGVSIQSMAMVAVHPWDLNGASALGCMTGWVNRTQRIYPPVFRAPTVSAPDIQGVVQALMELVPG
ncbi:MAG: haloacid dehalogenase type II [Acidimicrobiales bacterium]